MGERTYFDPGDCAKCEGGVLGPSLEFDGYEVGNPSGDPAMVGVLWAVCPRCGFKWVVKAKDESYG